MMDRGCRIAKLGMGGLLALLVYRGAPAQGGGDLQKFAGARMVEDPSNDGDSFLVEAGGRKFRARLYFVDAPETGAAWDADLDRIREQMRYFGLPDERKVVNCGRQAEAFTRAQLKDPFEVDTAFASALGRSAEGRVYAFVRTAEGKDLGRLLVQQGLARAYGVGRETPEGIGRAEWQARLDDLEASAMLKNRGAWKSSDSDRIEELRAAQRAEDNEMQKIRRHLIEDAPEGYYPLNINSCTTEELQSLKGIGPALAENIIAGRPYKRVDDLAKIRGISRNDVEQLRAFLAIQ